MASGFSFINPLHAESVIVEGGLPLAHAPEAGKMELDGRFAGVMEVMSTDSVIICIDVWRRVEPLSAHCTQRVRV